METYMCLLALEKSRRAIPPNQYDLHTQEICTIQLAIKYFVLVNGANKM